MERKSHCCFQKDDHDEDIIRKYCLRKNGDLFVMNIDYDFSPWRVTGQPGAGSRSKMSERSFGDSDVTLFDWSDECHRRETRWFIETSNLETGRKLLVNHKGKGLSLALKKLLE